MFDHENFPGNNPGKPKDDELNHWAHLEAKSDSMAEELAHRIEPSGVCPSVSKRLSCVCMLIVLVVLSGCVIAFLDW